ncbi:hybrid sensor histidine kinase/response regulator [Telluria sp. B2]
MTTVIDSALASAEGEGMRPLLHAGAPAGMPFGERASWPAPLGAIMDLMLGSRFPMFVAWGPELRVVYNETCAALLGERHPQAHGQPLASVCTDEWAAIMPVVDSALAGKSVLLENVQFSDGIEGGNSGRRRGRQVYVTLSLSPVHDGERSAGVYCVLTDTTASVLAAQQHGFQLELSAVLRELTDPVAIMEAASTLMGRHFAVGRVGYGEIDASGRHVSVERDWTDGSIASVAGETRPLDSFGPAIIDHLREGKVLRLDDIAADPRAAPYAAGYASIDARAMVIVPIIEGGRLAAIFYLHEPLARNWSEREVLLAEDVARQTREALRRARVEETLRDETRILEVLNRTGQALASTLDLNTLLQAITDAGTQLSGARFGAFFYNGVGDDGEVMKLYTLSGAAREDFAHLGAPRPTGLFNPTFHAQAPIRSADITLDPRYGQAGPHHGMPAGHLPVRSYLAVPVVSRSGSVMGGLIFGHPEPGVFTDRTERIVAGVAAQAAVAMDNARLYEVAQKSALERDALLQSERTARVEAERMSRMKDEFLAMLAHELRNPLAPISSSASLLSIQFAEEPRIRQTSAIISRQVRHMSRLIDDLLDVSRVTRGLVTLQLGEVDFRDVVRSALDQTRPLIEEKRHRIEVALPPKPLRVRGDQTRLTQSVANILNNAAKYTPQGGAIAAELESDGQRLRLRVRDNGSGMPPDLLPSVFELFTQGARTLARSQGGLGLGLALVKKLVELHGGSVAAWSAGVGKGSVFTIELPCLAAGEAGAAATGSVQGGGVEPAPRKRLRLIVVDDNEDAADSLATLLKAQGHTVMVEYTAMAALRRATSERPDAMLVDIGLPDMDGYQLAGLLRGQRETRHTVLIAATGYGQARDRQRAVEAGFAHHLVKPIDMAALVKILQTVAAERAG